MSLKSFLKRILPAFVVDAYHWFRGNLMVRLRLRWKKLTDRSLIPGKLTYAQDGLYTTHNVGFMNEERFLRSYELSRSTVGIYQDSKIHWRAYVVCWAALKARDLPGDFVECGVYRGFLSRMLIDYIDFATLKGKKFYLLDTFSGVPEASVSEEERKYGRSAGGYEDSYEQVKETFRPFDNVVIIRGMVPGTLERVPSQQIAYLSIDMNAAAPEIAAAEYFWPKIVSGGVMVLDDYGFATHVVQMRAFDDFAERHGVKVLPLPTGQGLIIKP